RDNLGGFDNASGAIISNGSLLNVTIGGSLIGGTGPVSGVIVSGEDMGAVKIGRNVVGGTGVGSGVVECVGKVESITFGGALIGGGDIAGNVADGAAGNFSPVLITARGQETPTTGVDLAIGKIIIGGAVDFTNILAGYTTDLTATNGDAQIGKVKVGGDWA